MNKSKVYLKSVVELSVFFLIVDAVLFYITKGAEFFALTKNVGMYIGVSLVMAIMLLFSVSWQYKKILLMDDEDLKLYKNPPWKRLILTSILMGLALSTFFVYLVLGEEFRSVTWVLILWVLFTLFYLVLKSYVFRFYKLMTKSA